MSDECGVFGELNGVGGFFISFIVIVYCFYAISAICKYLMQSLQVICLRLNLSPNVAGIVISPLIKKLGATFMAAGTSTPELFIAILDTFYTHNDIGTGAVVGSLIFNSFFMIGGSALIACTYFHHTDRIRFAFKPFADQVCSDPIYQF